MIRDPTVPRRHILWKTITTWRVTYVHKPTGNEIVVRTIGNTRPPDKRIFRTAHGRKKFKAVHIQRSRKELIIMAKSAAKSKKKDPEVEEEVLDAELEDLDELEELEEEVEDADVEDDDEDEAPAKKSKSGKKKKDTEKAKPSRSRTTDGKVGTAELAEKAGVDGRTLRMVLRKHNIAKDEETGRYEWPNFEDKEVKKILKLIAAGEAENIKKESLERLKETQAEKRKAKKDKKEKGKKGSKKSKKVVEDEDDDE